MKHLLLALMLTTAGTVLPPHAKADQALAVAQAPPTVHYRTATVDGQQVDIGQVGEGQTVRFTVDAFGLIIL